MSKKKEYPAGTTFGRWTIIGPGKSHQRWLCKCECGTVKEVIGNKLRGKISTSCGCVRNELRHNRNWTGYKEISGSRWKHFLYAAKSRNIGVYLSMEDAWNLFERQQHKCAITQLPLTMSVKNNGRYEQGTASLDRINSDKEYTLENVHWVHKDINIMKMDHSMQYFVQLCKAVVDHNST